MDKSKLADILYPLTYSLNYLRQKKDPVFFYNESETIDLLCQGYSIARFGDGELDIALGIGGITEFQEFSVDLKQKLLYCLGQYQNSTSKFLVAPLASLQSMRGYNLRQKKFYATYFTRRRNKIIGMLYNGGKNQKYGDPLFARVWGYHDYDSINSVYEKVEHLNKIWENKRILLIEGDTCKLGIGTDILYSAALVRRIIIPSRNAFEKYDLILDAVKRQTMFDLILIVAGPTATALAFDLYSLGYQAIDFGQMQKSYIEVIKKPYKFQHTIMTDDEYLEQIQERIG